MSQFPLNSIDFYKADHRSQYPLGTEMVYSNFTPRSSKWAKHLLLSDFDDRIVFLGLQGYIKEKLIKSWNEEFFNKPMEEVVSKYKRRMDASLGPDAISMDHIKALHSLGYLPLKIKALPEGSRVNIKVPCFTIQSTRPEFFWLTNYIESSISCNVWKPCTTATIAYEYKRLLESFAEKTGGDLDFVGLQAHDFSYRGMAGDEDAARSGIGHLASFIGTDTVLAIDYVEDVYGATDDLIGVSVPATEHSVMCMGSKEGEKETFRRLIEDIYPNGLVSIVSDTWDFWKVITEFTRDLKETILSRQPSLVAPGKVVFRPDSGDPANILCGYEVLDNIYDMSGCYSHRQCVLKDNKYYTIIPTNNNRLGYDLGDELTENEVKGAVECLWEIFSGTINEKGYKVLDEHVGLIFGDSITIERAKDILERLEAKGFASTNVVFGIGSYTYQHLTRDTFGFAMKATYGVVNGEPREIFKDPITDSGLKKSAKGLLRVEKTDNGYVLLDQQTPEQEEQTCMEVVFENGLMPKTYSWADVKRNLRES